MKRNSKHVLELLSGATAGLTRAEIRELTGLSKPTVQSIVAELRVEGRVTENSNGSNQLAPGQLAGGRPPERFILTPGAGLVAGVDIGHGHVRVAIADRSGRVVGEIREDATIDVDDAGVSALMTAVELMDGALSSGEHSAAAIRALAVGIPAAIDRSGTVLFSDALPSWATVNIGDELLKLLRRRFAEIEIDRSKVRVENDANLGAVGEGCCGAAEGKRHYLYIKVSTGIGMGIVVRGNLYRGFEGGAGEFGHTSVSPMASPFLSAASNFTPGPCPRCSKFDCLENLASGQSILRQLNMGTAKSMSDQQIEQVVTRATTDAVGFRTSLQAIVDAGTRIGYTLADVVRVCAPEVVVVGGLLAEAGDTLVKPIKDAIAGMKGLTTVEIRAVEKSRIRRSELDGAIAVASRIASFADNAKSRAGSGGQAKGQTAASSH
jgi:predicted NBD/HSP70 family sugar kinase